MMMLPSELTSKVLFCELGPSALVRRPCVILASSSEMLNIEELIVSMCRIYTHTYRRISLIWVFEFSLDH